MSEDSNQNSLRTEWKLLIHSFLEDAQDPSEDSLSHLKIRIKEKKTSFTEIQKIKKSLSTEKKHLNQKIESIKFQIDQLGSTLQNLELVGSDMSEANEKLNELVRQGEKTSLLIELLDTKLQKIRNLESGLVG